MPPNPKPVVPILECVEQLDGGNYLAHWGYENKNGTTVEPPSGENKFSPGEPNRGQPKAFAAARQVGLGDQAAAAAGGEPELADELGRLDAARPDHRPGQDLGAVAQPHSIGEDLVDAGRHAQDDADVGELLRRVVVGGVGEGGQDDGPVVDEVDARALRVEVVERFGEHVVDEVAERAGRLHPGRPGAHDDDVERASAMRAGSLSAASKTSSSRVRSRLASSTVYSGKACCSAPGVWKKFGREPAATTR